MKHVAPPDMDYRQQEAVRARNLRRMAREYLAWAEDDLAHGRRARAARMFKEWRDYMKRARDYGKGAVQ